MSRPGYVDKRGSNTDRARRRAWILETFDPELGPAAAKCRLKLARGCLDVVDAETLSVDRIDLGGTYARHNIRPACKPCQDLQGHLNGRGVGLDEVVATFRDARDAWEARFEAATHRTYRPGIIEEERRLERRGGRREVTDFVETDPPPMLKDFLEEWGASRREPLDPWADQEATG